MASFIHHPERWQEPEPASSERRKVLTHFGALGIESTAKRSPGAFSPQRGPASGTAIGPDTQTRAERLRVMREFGSPFDIDHTIKRSAGGFSPTRPSNIGETSTAPPSEGPGHSPQGYLTLKAFGFTPGIDQVHKRSLGSCSPQRDRSLSERRTAPVQQVLDAQSNRVLGVYGIAPSIDTVGRRSAGEYSPMRRRQTGTSPWREAGRSLSPMAGAPRAATPMGSRSSQQAGASAVSGTDSQDLWSGDRGRRQDPPVGSPARRQRTPEAGRSAGRPTHITVQKAKEPAKGVVPGLPATETSIAKARGACTSLSRASTADPSLPDCGTYGGVWGGERPRSPAPTRDLSPFVCLSSGQLPPAIRVPTRAWKP